MIKKNSVIFVAGHKGLVGNAILKKLKSKGYKNILVVDKNKLDLVNQDKVIKFLKKKRPDFIFIAAAKVGGILANKRYKAEFIYENLQIQINLIHGAYVAGIKSLIFLGSSCVYPKNCRQPIKEVYLLNGYLEDTNDAYAVAKIAGIKMCESYNKQYKTNYKCLMPCNAYGINDNYDPDASHFFPALIKKVIDAIRYQKESINIWGNGKPLRELIYSDDIAEACIFFLKKKTKETLINIGTGKDKSITEYAKLIMKHIGVNLKIINKGMLANITLTSARVIGS